MEFLRGLRKDLLRAADIRNTMGDHQGADEALTQAQIIFDLEQKLAADAEAAGVPLPDTSRSEATFGGVLKEVRKASRLSLQVLSDRVKIDITRQALHQIEREQVNPSAETRIELIAFFGGEKTLFGRALEAAPLNNVHEKRQATRKRRKP